MRCDLDPEARHYQDQLHQANQERMRSFETKLDRTLEAMIAIGKAIECIPDMDQRIDKLEADRQQRKGAMAVLAFLCGLVGAGIEALVHYASSK